MAGNGAQGRSWVASLTDLDEVGGNLVCRAPQAPQGRLFGGLIAAHALYAASHTTGEGKIPASLHAYFVRVGRPNVDVVYEVERTRDGGAFDTRRITALQEGKAILEMLASFHAPEPGFDHHPPAPPIALPEDTASVAGPGDLAGRFEIRTLRESSFFSGPPYWIRVPETVPDDPIIQACVLTFLSDMGLMAVSRPTDANMLIGGIRMAASLDHSVWFHRPFDPEGWHLYQAEAHNNSDSRGLARGAFYDLHGSLIASMAQEALWRA